MRKFLIGLVVVLAALAGAFYYFSEADIPRATLEAKYATPPSQFVTISYPPTSVAGSATLEQPPPGAYDTRVHIRDVGPRDAPVIVLVHGSNASLFTWEPWSKRLSDTFRVVSLDLPGHGLTGAVPSHDYSQKGMVEFVKAVTDKLGIKKFAIAGNSMGGGVAARFAETYPDSLTHLILVDAGGMPSKQGDRTPLAFQIARIPVLNQIVLHITPRSLVVDGLNKAIMRKEIITDKMIDMYWDFALMEGTRAATGARFQLAWDWYVRDHAKDIRTPTLILWGDQDGLIPVEAAHEFNKAISGSKLIIYKNVGHIPMEEVADQSAADVRAFLTPATDDKSSGY
ncbi:MAG: alpha/beta hydrolase [Proteobacteria bacterium]|nr:alpha/beta hydrolase [Pseudomonadota bacterium]